jgi:type II secretory pathway predicted ATPase ExeA
LSEHPDLTGSRLGNYRLTSVLGRGRMGIVYLAHDEALLRPTALKVLSWCFLESRGSSPEAWFLAEARNVARVNHPAVIQIYNAAKQGNHCYIAMEYVEGLSGDALVSRNGPLSPIDATQVVLQIAGALSQAHGCNIIHRDVKPANVLIRSDGTAKLGDFGMALHTTGHTPRSTDPVGTPYYMAPELWQGTPANPASDIYALGATYFCLLTGRPPYPIRDLPPLIQAHAHSPVPDPTNLVASVPAKCAGIVRKCLAKSPGDRYRSVQELSWDLRGLLRGLDDRARPPAAARSAERQTATDAAPEGRVPSPDQPGATWWRDLGLTLRPFGDIDLREVPYLGEPLRSVREQIETIVRCEPGSTIVLAGAPGSGRTALVRSAQMDGSAATPMAYLNLDSAGGEGTRGRTLAQWACEALGAVPGPSVTGDSYLERLIEHLAADARPAALVFDAVPEEASVLESLATLARAAYGTKCMSLLVVASPGFTRQLSLEGVDPAAVKELSVPPLDGLQTEAYLRSWIAAAQAPGAAPLLFTPDAAVVICHRADGNLRRINALATNILQLAALDRRRVLPSWYAWGVSHEEGWVPEASQVGRPPAWPPRQVLALLNAHRERAGMPLRCAPEA